MSFSEYKLNERHYFSFSLDVRGKPLNQASHWAESTPLGRRTTFSTKSQPNSLHIEGLTLQVNK